MSDLYFETSAVLAWLLEESDFEKIVEIVDQQDAVITSVLTPIEARRSLIRLEASGQIKNGTRYRIEGQLNQAIKSWRVFELTADIQSRAGQPFPIEPVRSLDAIHLATILEAVKAYPDLEVITLDKRIRANLEPLGLVAKP